MSEVAGGTVKQTRRRAFVTRVGRDRVSPYLGGSTLYHNLGINLSSTTLVDANGRPHYLVEGGAQPIAELN